MSDLRIAATKARARAKQDGLDARVLGVLTAATQPLTVSEIIAGLGPLTAGGPSRKSIAAAARRLVAAGQAVESTRWVESEFLGQTKRAAAFGVKR